MWSNNQNIQKAQAQARNFLPPYCANPFCLWHHPSNLPKQQTHFHKFASRPIARFPYLTQRFRCLRCRKTFAGSFFSLQYRDRRPDTYEEMHDLLRNGYAKVNVAKRLKISEATVRRRKKKLARWALLHWEKDRSKVKIKESVAYDGLENFAYSQYDPNNVNHAVGRETFYVYDFNLSPMNRKGAMNDSQRRKKQDLEECFGKYPSSAIQDDSRRLFARLLEMSAGTLHLHSDNHYAYRRAIATLPNKQRLVHAITPAKLGRNFRNRLFAINHTDMLTRHLLGSYKRETIAFAKNTIAMIEDFILFATYKNYMRPKFLRKQKRDPKAHLESPAMALGLRNSILRFSEIYRTRISVHHVQLSSDWQNYFDSFDPASRRTIRPYAGI